ncbi:AAA family ATPase [Microcoleus sp. A006_D1]|uniref:AAA family ATPase n=1 Tax=Microcoleus sp. A006_D1 TaxID=3055267 RepID=UPI002FD2EB08
MKIISLQLKNHFLGWDFDEIKFSSNLTLLVGISGAGKTQILRSIIDLKRIANGKAINGLEWKIIFSTVNGTEFIWEGGFDTVETNELNFDNPEKDNQDEKEKPSFIYEKLISKNEVLFERNKEQIKFKNSQMPKLSSHQSMIILLKEESVIKEAFDALNKIEYRDHTIKGVRFRSSKQSLHSLKNKYQTLESIVNSDEDIRTKLYLTYENKLDVFETIKSRLIDVFQQIEDVKVEPFKTDELPKAIAANIFFPVISIKEKSVPKWIREDRMSSGMLRTIIHLGEIFLSNEGSVILIDEFENSLGINCIDILTDDLIHENKTLQFIATSHHPYIINNIPYEYWKIVTRQGGHIRTCNASDYHLGKSKQDAFIQLNKILEKQS